MPSLRSALIDRDYARLWYGQAVSTLGDLVFDTTLVLWVATILARGKTWAPAAVSGVMLSVALAVLVVGPVAGVFVDRWSRRRTMLRSEVIRAVLVGGITALAFLPTSALPTWLWLTVIYIVVFIVNVCEMFFNPSRFATIAEVVTGDVDRARAAGLSQATSSALAIIGPPLAAPLLFTIGLQWALMINALSYVVSFFAIRSVRVTQPTLARGEALERPSLRADFVAGLRFFVRSRFLVALLAVATIAQFGTGAMNALDVFFVTSNLHANARLFGVMSMAFGIGSILGALLAGVVVARIGAKATTWSGLIAAGVFIFGYSRQDNIWGGLIFIVLFALPITMLNTSISPMLLRATPQEYLGRVISVFGPINQLASMLSVVLAGWLASTVLLHFHLTIAGARFGRIDTVFAVSGLLIVAAGVYAFLVLPGDSTDEQPEPPREPAILDAARGVAAE